MNLLGFRLRKHLSIKDLQSYGRLGNGAIGVGFAWPKGLQWRRFLAVTAGLSCSISWTGCAKEPYAATTNLRLTDEERSQKVNLSAADDREVEGILGSVARGESVVDPPGPAPHGMRWSDLPQAVDAACEETEMAVVRTTTHTWGTEFVIVTVEDYPGTLTVKNVGEPAVYEADASIGLFGNHETRANALLAALRKSMLAFGKKREFDVDPVSIAGSDR